MKMKILIQNYKNQDIFYADNDSLYLNGEKQKYNAGAFIFEVMSLIKDWPQKLYNPAISDGLKCEIDVDGLKYSWINKFPQDFEELESILRRVKNV